MFQLLLADLVFFMFILCLELEAAKNDKSSNSEEVDKLKFKLEQEKIMKTQAVNKLAEIVQRKGLTPGKRTKADSNTVKRKDYKKLEFELHAVMLLFVRLFVLYLL